MPVINKRLIKKELRELVDNSGALKANFVMGFMWAYVKFVDKNIKCYDIRYNIKHRLAENIVIEYVDGKKEDIDLT